MKTILVMVASVDGRSTKGNSPEQSWISNEDHEHFTTLLQSHTLLIMGRNTYETAKLLMKHNPGRLRVVLTHHPEKYRHEEIPGMLEFSDEPAKKLFDRLSRDFSEALLLSGAELNGVFFREHLVDELVLTIEPKLLGKGSGIVGFDDFDIDLTLKSIEKLNSRGTLLLRYNVSKD